MEIDNVIFEHGIEIQRTREGNWLFTSAPRGTSGMPPAQVRQVYCVRPILIAERLADGTIRSLLLPINLADDLLGIQTTGLTQGVFQSGAPVIMQALNIQNVVGAVCHHCEALAEHYSRICSEFARLPFSLNGEDRATFSYQHEPYYEFEALITAAHRAYNATRFLLWKEFSREPDGTTPSSFRRALERCPRMPPNLRERLSASWQEFGIQIRDYRDCVQHYVPLGRQLPYAMMERLQGGVWSMSAPIPDNPQTRSSARFTYTLSRDALSYGWAIANEIVDVAKPIIDTVR